MAILNPDELLGHAERLILQQSSGSSRRTDLRRAISACYYAVFHHVLAEAADLFVGKALRAQPRYNLVYRSLDHGRLRDLCIELRKRTPSAKYVPFLPSGVDSKIIDFASIVIDLQDQRHTADYNPNRTFSAADALQAARTAREGVARFHQAKRTHRELFLTLALFPPRR